MSKILKSKEFEEPSYPFYGAAREVCMALSVSPWEFVKDIFTKKF